MPSKPLLKGVGLKTTEYDVRQLNIWGDAQDINFYETKEEAIKEARKIRSAEPAENPDDRIVAVVVEKHVTKMPAHLFGDPNVYTPLLVIGDKQALSEWGWEASDCPYESVP